MTRQDLIHEFQSTLSKQDTLDMLKLTDDAMEKLHNKQFDAVLASLHIYDDSLKTVNPLPESEKAKIQKMFNYFPVQKFKRTYFSFQLEGCNDVNYEITFDSIDSAKTHFMFNPVKVDGIWYLCVKGEKDEIDEKMR